MSTAFFPDSVSSPPIKTRSAFSKSSIAVPSAKNSGFDNTSKLNLLSGVRVDNNNLVDNLILSPRFSLLYKSDSNIQFRTSWSTGFRAPQAFDTDLHIAFAGGGVSRITLANDLKEEYSNSFSGSINYDKSTEDFVAGFTLEAFYTKLKDAFYLNH